ncbi:MAG: hypothetical protein ABGW97_15955 [Christiangramia sp.]|uniref:hypothetical protein n=1 Tax=Christiangramia sp. TaxID=1931228 RepID=UPI003241EE6A
MSRPERLKRRNSKVRDFISSLEKKHPQWRFDAVVEETADNFFISPRTVEAILRREGVYAD